MDVTDGQGYMKGFYFVKITMVATFCSVSCYSPTNDIWCWTIIGPMLVWWWLANKVPILARWTKTLLAQHWLAYVGLTLTSQWYLMLDLCWSNAGMMMVSQHCANMANSACPMLACQCWTNVSADIGPAFVQCWSAIWDGINSILKGYNVFSVSMKTTLPPVYPWAPGSCVVTETNGYCSVGYNGKIEPLPSNSRNWNHTEFISGQDFDLD